MALTNFSNLGNLMMKITAELLNNQNLCKYLYYNSSAPLLEPDIENTKETLFGTHINIKPVIPKQEMQGSYVNVITDMILTDEKNPDFFVVSLRFDILCPINAWEIDDTQLRPFAIMEEIDKYMRHSQKSAIGSLESKSAALIAPTADLAGYSIFYTGTEFK